MIKIRHWYQFLPLIALVGCHSGDAPLASLFENAEPESFSQVVRITGELPDEDTVSFAYLTGPENAQSLYKLSCPHPSIGEDSVGLKKMMAALGYELSTLEQPPLLNAQNTTQKALLEKWNWGKGPTLKCRYPEGKTSFRSVQFPEPINETKYFVSFDSRRTSDGKIIMHNLGCEGAITALGLDKARAIALSYDSYEALKTDYESSDAYDISCITGTKPSSTTSFVNSCKLAKNSADSIRWKTFKVLIRSVGLKDTSVTACEDAEAKINESTKISLAGQGIVDLFPLSYFNQITELDLSQNMIIDFSPLASLYQLKVLQVDDNGLTGLKDLGAALRNLNFLTTLSVKANALTSTEGLEQLNNLSSLEFGLNRDLQDISSLKSLSRLKELGISSTQVKDLSPLGDLKNLVKLDATDLTGLNFLSFEPLKTTSLKAENLKLTGTILTWSRFRQSTFTNCLLYGEIPDNEELKAEKAAIKADLTKLGQVFVGEKPTVSCQNLQVKSTGTWTRDPFSDNGQGGGVAGDGQCNGKEDCVYVDNLGRSWKGWDKNSRTFADAVSYCQTLDYGGYSDWEVPSKADLVAAFDLKIWTLNSTAFNVYGSWSMTSAESDENFSQFLMIGQNGKSVDIKKSAKTPYLICVRK